MKTSWIFMCFLVWNFSVFATPTKSSDVCVCDPVADSLELVNFYNNFNGPGWVNSNNWLVPGQPISTWNGITTNMDGCVQQIFLTNNLLSGDLYEINFSELEIFKVFRNQISGTAIDFSNMPLLKEYSISDNLLEGGVPDFQNMPGLEILSLSQNALGGEIPNFTNLPNLTRLSLVECGLTGEVPDFSNLPNLRELWLWDNLLIGEVPDFTNLPELRNLNISENQLTGTLPDFSNMPELLRITLNDNLLTGTLPDFSNLDTLEQISLYRNQLSGEIPDFSNLPCMRAFALSHNQLSGEIPDFSNMPKLVSFSATHNKLTGSIPNFSNTPVLQDLILIGNELSGELPDFTDLPELWVLVIDDNQLTGELPNFTNMPSLLFLVAANNQFTGVIPGFTGAPNLLGIYLNANNITGELPDFSGLPALTYLYLQDNNFSGPIPDFLTFDTVNISDNLYTFTDLIATPSLVSPSFNYAPQKLFYQDTFIKLEKDQMLEVDLAIDAGLGDNLYEWWKDSLTWTPPAGNDPSTNKLIFPDIQATDAGRYYAEVTNPAVPDLTLFSQRINIQVCDEQMDSLELVELYNATGGGVSWNNEMNWLVPGQPISNWFGITPDEFGCVKILDLNSNGLTGQLPLLTLNTLDTLILSGNEQLNGNIPELEIPFVRYFDIDSCDMTGAIPDALLTWYDMTYLNLSSNNLTNSIPPDLGDLCDLESLYLDNNQFDEELPEELTRLFNLQIGQVDFSNNFIDSLEEKIIWFCPYGDTILQDNPSYDRFLGICNVQCTGEEWDNLLNFPWIPDTLASIPCDQPECTYQAGFIDVRGIKVVFTRTVCDTVSSSAPFPPPNEEVFFYDCAGNLLELANKHPDGYTTLFGGISLEEFNSLEYDIRWTCFQEVKLLNAVEEPIKENTSSTSQIKILQCAPNPVDVLLTCEKEEKVKPGSVEVFDLMGGRHAVQYQIWNERIQFDMNHLPPGLYVISIQGEKARYVAKIVVE